MKRLLNQEKQGKPVPELYTRPILDNEEEMFWYAWQCLQTERQVGMALGDIPHSQVVNYAVREGLDAFELWTIIHALDEHWREELDKNKPSGGNQGGGLSDQSDNRPIRRGRRKSSSDE